MNTYHLIAGILCIILGVGHSVLGEVLIFCKESKGGDDIPYLDRIFLQKEHTGILWATWHLASIFGWFIGALLIKFAIDPDMGNSELLNFISIEVILAMAIASFLVLVGTKGRHPGWIILAVIGALMFLGS